MAQAQTMTGMMMDNAKKFGGDAMDLGRDVFLAGVGVFATAGEQAQDLFTQMVDKGKKAEKDEKRLFVRATQEVKNLGERVETSVRSTVSGTLNRVGVPSRDEIHSLTDRVEQLTKKLEQRMVK